MMTNATMKLLLICVCIIANYQYAASMTRENYELYQKYGALWPEYQEVNELIKEYPLSEPKIIKCRSRYNKHHIKQKKQIFIPYENLKRVETTKSPYEETIKYIDNPKYNKPLLHEILTTKSKEPNTDVKYKIPKDLKHLDKYGYILKELAHLPREESVSTMKISNIHDQNVNNNLLNDPKTKWVVVKAEGQKAHAKLELDNSESPIIRLDDTKGGKKVFKPNEDVNYKIPKDQNHMDKHGSILKKLAHLPREESTATMKISDIYDQNENNDPQTKWIVVKAEGQKAHAKLELDNSSAKKDNREDTKYKAEVNEPLNVVSHDSESPVFRLHETKGDPVSELKTKPDVFDGIIFNPNKHVQYKIPKDEKHLDKHGSILKKLAHLPREESTATMKISDIYDQNENNDPQTKWIVVKAEGQKAHAKLELDNSGSPIIRLDDTTGEPDTELKTNPIFDGIIVGEPAPPTRDNPHMYNAIIVGEHEEEYDPSIFTLFE